MKRNKQQRAGELKVSLSSEVMAAVDDFARAQGLSRAEAVRAALFYCPSVANFITHGPVSSRDVLGP
jgi:Ribbon-helix-helix protein, copG family